jgi:hypothetical protein
MYIQTTNLTPHHLISHQLPNNKVSKPQTSPTMPLTLSLLSDSDAHAFAVVDDAAMADWPYAIAMGLNLPGPRIQMVEDWVRHGLQVDSTQTYLQVKDDETGEMVAGAMWRFVPVGEGKSEIKSEVNSEVGKKTSEKKAEQDERAGMAEAFAAARKEMWEEFEGTFFPGERYASEYLPKPPPPLEKKTMTANQLHSSNKTSKFSSQRPRTAAEARLHSSSNGARSAPTSAGSRAFSWHLRPGWELI